MKKLLIVFFALFLACLNFSCKTVDPKKLYPDMVADLDPVSVGIIEAEYKTILGKLNKFEVETIFYPRYNAVVLNFKYQFTTYRQFWTPEGRDLFIKASESYNNDYTLRNLNRKLKFSRTRRTYGKFTGGLEWTHGKYAQTSESSPIFELGYSFQGEKNKETPFLTVTQNSATETSVSDGSKLDSVHIYMYFTREQAASLARVFDQNSLLGFIESSKPKIDEYTDTNQDYGEYVP